MTLAKLIKGEIKLDKRPEKDASGQALLKEVDRFLLKQTETRHKKVHGFAPSNWQMDCGRYWFLLFEGVEFTPKFKARDLRIFDNGHGMHARWQQYFEDMGILVEKEVPVVLNDPIPIGGSADAIVDWSGRKVIELKSMKHELFTMRKFYNKPSETHLAQINIYMHCLSIKHGIIIYENKDTQETLAFDVVLDEGFIDKIMKKKVKIYEVIKKGELPPRPYKRTSPHCVGCPLEITCWDILEDGKV